MDAVAAAMEQVQMLEACLEYHLSPHVGMSKQYRNEAVKHTSDRLEEAKRLLVQLQTSHLNG